MPSQYQLPLQPKKQASKTNLISGIMGSLLEWYDFLLYVYFASILAPLFFPTKSQFMSIILTFGVFALGFLARPVGALVIGQWGDLHGRRKTLIYTISLMTIPTVMIGLLPTYATIGVAAPILLTLIRCVQGFVVSGEISSAAAFLVEHAEKNRRGFAGSLIMASAMAGILLGAAVVALQAELMPAALLKTWGWRIPFLLAGVFGVLGLVVRLRAVESPEFTTITTQSQQRSPIKQLLLNYKLIILRGILMTLVVAIGNYFLVGYFTTYLVQSAKMPLNQAMLINVISLAVFAVVLPLFGLLSDYLGRRRVFMVGTAALIITAVPIFLLLTQKIWASALWAEILFVIVLAPVSGLILTILSEQFPTEVRNTGTSICYNSALALFGGTAPLIALSLTELLHSQIAPSGYIIAGAIISTLAIWPLSLPKKFASQPIAADVKT